MSEAAEMDPQQRQQYDKLKKAFEKYHAAKPEVYELIKTITFRMIAGGRKHNSINNTLEQVRWDYNVKYDGKKEFKIANDHRPFYSRMFAAEFPEHADFYRFRYQFSKKKPARRGPEPVPADFPYIDPLLE